MIAGEITHQGPKMPTEGTPDRVQLVARHGE